MFICILLSYCDIKIKSRKKRNSFEKKWFTTRASSRRFLASQDFLAADFEEEDDKHFI